jgi:peptidoglycan/xylan/chitin deacetylase (PgdA/CDA1 family)
MFVPTGTPDADRAFWWDRLWDAVRSAPAGVVDGPNGPLELWDEASRRAATRTLIDTYKRMAHEDAMAQVDALIEGLGGATERRLAGADAVKSRRPREADHLSWDEIRRLTTAGLHVAPHSRSHPLLTRLEPAGVEQELAGSRDELEQRLGSLAFGSVFAYPAGAHNAATRDALVGQGFELAFTTERGINRAGESDSLALRRINVGMRAGPELVRAQMAFFTLRYRTRGV